MLSVGTQQVVTFHTQPSKALQNSAYVNNVNTQLSPRTYTDPIIDEEALCGILKNN